MKKKSLLIILPIICSISSLTSCANSRAITIFNNFDQDEYTFKNISDNELSLLLDTKQTFVLYISEDACSTCQKVNTYFENYLNENHELIYKYEIDNPKNDYFYLQNKYPSYFSKDLYLPDIKFFSLGVPSVTLSSAKYSSEVLFKSSLDEFLKRSNMQYSTHLSSVDKYKNANEDFVLYLASSSIKESYEIFSNHIYDLVSKDLQEFMFIDISNEDMDVLNEFKKANNISLSNSCFALSYKDQKIEKTFDYLQDQNSLNELISYLEE